MFFRKCKQFEKKSKLHETPYSPLELEIYRVKISFFSAPRPPVKIVPLPLFMYYALFSHFAACALTYTYRTSYLRRSPSTVKKPVFWDGKKSSHIFLTNYTECYNNILQVINEFYTPNSKRTFHIR